MTSIQPPPAQTPQRSIDAIIGANVHQLMWARQETQTLVAPLWGMDQTTLSMKLRGRRPWFASEIVAAASRYGVPVGRLFKELPDLDSNQKPIAFKSHYIGLDQLAEHRRAKDAAHNEVQRIRGTRAG